MGGKRLFGRRWAAAARGYRTDWVFMALDRQGDRLISAGRACCIQPATMITFTFLVWIIIGRKDG